jgi:hypothetical protein
MKKRTYEHKNTLVCKGCGLVKKECDANAVGYICSNCITQGYNYYALLSDKPVWKPAMNLKKGEQVMLANNKILKIVKKSYTIDGICEYFVCKDEFGNFETYSNYQLKRV